MKDLKRLLAQITELTTKIETDYPELYHFLDESPITLPDVPHPDMGEAVLQEYLDNLQELLDHHLTTHQKKNETF
jgi:hypothetical protein